METGRIHPTLMEPTAVQTAVPSSTSLEYGSPHVSSTERSCAYTWEGVGG